MPTVERDISIGEAGDVSIGDLHQIPECSALGAIVPDDGACRRIGRTAQREMRISLTVDLPLAPATGSAASGVGRRSDPSVPGRRTFGARRLSIGCAPEVRFAEDSPVEEDGFEPSVPRKSPATHAEPPEDIVPTN